MSGKAQTDNSDLMLVIVPDSTLPPPNGWETVEYSGNGQPNRMVMLIGQSNGTIWIQGEVDKRRRR